MKACIHMRNCSIVNSVKMKAFKVCTIKIIIWNHLYNEPVFYEDFHCHLKVHGMCCVVDVEDLVVLWWTPFTGQKGAVRNCGAVKCFFTEDRRFSNHNLTKVNMTCKLMISFWLSRSWLLSVTCPGTMKNIYIWCFKSLSGKKNESLQNIF
jgi:hypothetical protein